MGNLSGVEITRGSIGVNVSGNMDAISGLLLTGIATNSIAIDKTVRLLSLKEAEGLGLTKDYDTTNNVRVHRHISEFYRLAGSGTPLYICLYSGLPKDALGDAAKSMLAEARGEIRQLAIAYSPISTTETPYAPVLVNGLEPDVYDCLQAGQNLALWAAETFKPMQVLVEGRGISDTTAGLLNLKNIEVNDIIMQYTKVSLCIGQDFDYASSQDEIGQKMADVGSMLGTLASKVVNENIGEVETSRLTDVNKALWVNAGLSNHKTIEEMGDYLSDLDDKGYIFPISYTGITGYYWNGDYTCTAPVVDDDGKMNEWNISYGRTLDKAIRELRIALLPKVKSTQAVDASTGKLAPGTIKYFEALGDRIFDRLGDVISYGKTHVDPNSDLLTLPRELKVSFEIVPTGQIDIISGTINLTK